MSEIVSLCPVARSTHLNDISAVSERDVLAVVEIALAAIFVDEYVLDIDVLGVGILGCRPPSIILVHTDAQAGQSVCSDSECLIDNLVVLAQQDGLVRVEYTGYGQADMRVVCHDVSATICVFSSDCPGIGTRCSHRQLWHLQLRQGYF